MNVIFNKIFWKAFAITLAVVQLLAIITSVSKYLELITNYLTPLPFAFKFFLTASILLLPTSLCSAIAVSSFVSFRYALINGNKDFFKLLGLGVICFLVFSIGVYLYDCNIQPKLKQQSMEMLWKIKTGSIYPEKIEEKTDQDLNFKRMPEFEDFTPSVLSCKRIRFMSDSLKRQQQKQIIEVERLLAILPPELAEEAYKSYNLKQMGVEFQFAKTVEFNSDSLTHIQQISLYEEASLLSETTIDLIRYKIESWERFINAACCLFSFLIFATLGYFLKNKSLTKIFGIVAIVIVSIWVCYSTIHFMEGYFKEVIKSIR